MDARHAVLFERWCAHGLYMPAGIDGEVARFHPSLKFGDDRAAGLVWLLRDVSTDEPVAIQRMYLSRRMASPFRKAHPGPHLQHRHQTHRQHGRGPRVLHIATDVESALAAMAQGYCPMWALTGARALSDFPVLNIECLTIITDDADAQAVAAVTRRWTEAGREMCMCNSRDRHNRNAAAATGGGAPLLVSRPTTPPLGLSSETSFSLIHRQVFRRSTCKMHPAAEFDKPHIHPLRAAFPSLIPSKLHCADVPSDGLMTRFRRSALKYRHVQLNGPAGFRWMPHDIDRADAYFAHRDANLPEPNFIAINPENGHAHSAILLAVPVACHSASRDGPLRFYAAVERGYRAPSRC